MKHYNFSSNLIQVGEIREIRAKSVRNLGFFVRYPRIWSTISDHPLHNIRASGAQYPSIRNRRLYSWSWKFGQVQTNPGNDLKVWTNPGFVWAIAAIATNKPLCKNNFCFEKMDFLSKIIGFCLKRHDFTEC